ncbi:MAG TPA: hypothetical protein PKK95_13815 [Vicinamibacterales bacterium]|nr:hypothetical protein [Vicinamibacterales bacterium]
MRRHSGCPIACLTLLVLAAAAATAFAQAPQTYTITMKQGPNNTTIVTSRDGSKESVEQKVPPSKIGPGMHVRLLYDLAAHKLWSMDLEGGPCSVVAYTSPEVPGPFDPISSGSETMARMSKEKLTPLRSETINGLATKLYEIPAPEIKGKVLLFVEEKQNFPVKQVFAFGDGREITAMEITSLSFDKPPADLFVPPKGCQEIAGSTSATGGHAETQVEEKAAGEQQLGEKQAAPRRAPARASGSARTAAAAAVTEVRAVGVQPSHYTAAAPAAYVFTFAITASGPLEAQWVLVSQADTAWASGKLAFEAAGTKELEVPVKIGVGNGQHWEGSGHLEVVVSGKRTFSEKLPVSADCQAK